MHTLGLEYALDQSEARGEMGFLAKRSQSNSKNASSADKDNTNGGIAGDVDVEYGYDGQAAKA